MKFQKNFNLFFLSPFLISHQLEKSQMDKFNQVAFEKIFEISPNKRQYLFWSACWISDCHQNIIFVKDHNKQLPLPQFWLQFTQWFVIRRLKMWKLYKGYNRCQQVRSGELNKMEKKVFEKNYKKDIYRILILSELKDEYLLGKKHRLVQPVLYFRFLFLSPHLEFPQHLADWHYSSPRYKVITIIYNPVIKLYYITSFILTIIHITLSLNSKFLPSTQNHPNL